MAIDIDITTTFLGDTDAPDTYVGQASKVVSVKTDETGLEFTTPAAGGDTNIMNANLTLDIDRTQNLNSKSLYFNNGKQFKWLNNVAPTIGEGSFDLQGYGTTASDVLLRLKNGAGDVNFFTNGKGQFDIGNSSFTDTQHVVKNNVNFFYIHRVLDRFENVLFDVARTYIKLVIATGIGTDAEAGRILTTDGLLRFKNLPTSSAGLSAGDLWNDLGTIKII